MKKLIPLLALGLFLVGCNEKKNKNSTLFEFEELGYNLIAQWDDPDMREPGLGGGDGSFNTYGKFILPIKINDNDITALRDSLMRLSDITINDKGEVYPDLEGLTITGENPKMTEYSTNRTETLSIALLNPRLIVWQNYSFEYMGGAHGYGYDTYVNYSIGLNKILSLEDILKPGFEAPLNKLVRENLRWQFNADLLLVDISDVEYSNIFKVTPDGITFYYPPYAIAPYSEGEVEIAISLSDLENERLLNREIKDQVFGI